MAVLDAVGRKHIGIVAAVIAITVLGIFFLTGQEATNTPQEPVEGEWTSMPLTDVRNSDTFTISDFEEPVIVETFAVWCTTCTRQQKEIQTLHEAVGEDIVSVTLNIDPNEDADKVREHLDRHGFDWRYAVAPPEMTQDLINDFGRSITVAPRAPMVVVCPDGTVDRLPDGVKPADMIQSSVDETCNV